MNKTALRRILSSEGLLPRNKQASKGLARAFADFYRGVQRDLGLEGLDVRKAVSADLKKIVAGMGNASANLGTAYADDENFLYATEVTIAEDFAGEWSSLEENIVLPTRYYVTGTISVIPLPFKDSYLYDSLISQREKRAMVKKWDAFILKVMESEDFQQALLRKFSRWQEDAHSALQSEAYDWVDTVENGIERFSNEGSTVTDFPSPEDDSYWNIRADLLGVSRRGEYTIKFTGVMDAEKIVDGMEFDWVDPRY